MSLIVRFTAALWAALTNINADHRQSKLRLINNLLPHSRHCNINVAPWHSSLRHTQNPPHCTRERGKKKEKIKKNVSLLLEKKMRGARAQAQQPSPRLPRLPVSPSFAWAQAQQPARFLYDTLSHPIQLSHRLRVVVSPVPAACPLRPLDTQFWLTLREWHNQPTNKGRVSSPTNAAPLPFRAAA